MAESWVRLWSGMTTDPKWQTIARKSGQPRALVIALFTHLMLEANESEDRGSVSSIIVEDIASALDCDEEAVEAILAAMDGRVITDGRLSGWDVRQPVREDSGNEKTGALSSTERSRLFRAKKKATETQSNDDATQCNARNDDATQCNAPEAEAEADSKNPLSVEAAAVTGSSTGEKIDLLPPNLDPIHARSVQLAILLRERGAQTQPSDPRLRNIAESGATDAQVLSALEIAQQRRADSKSHAPIHAGFIASILPDVMTEKPASRSTSPPQQNAKEAGRRAAARSIFPDAFADQPAGQRNHERTIDAEYARLD